MRYHPDDIRHWVSPALTFLGSVTPPAWLDWALGNIDLLLIDHANCERKAAVTALTLMQRHLDDAHFLQQLSKLAREELVHFEQVLKIMQETGVRYQPLSAAGYARGLLAAASDSDPWNRIDRLLISAIIEARSCERFAALVPRLEEPLQSFYLGLLRSEARHFEIYRDKAAALAGHSGDNGLAERTETLLAVESRLIEGADSTFRFHSGVPRELVSPA